jgi:Domain of unknown function (DUF6265)
LNIQLTNYYQVAMHRSVRLSLASAIAVAGLLAATNRVNARRVRASPNLAARSPSTLARQTRDFAWLAGTWEGHLVGANDILTELTFQPPSEGLMSGVMRLSQGGKPVLLELISVMDGPGGVELRFRHFDGALAAMESTFRQVMVLKTSTDSSDTFENAVAFDRTLVSTQPRISSWTRRGPNDMVARSDLLGADAKPGKIEVVYHRMTH